MLIVKSAAPNFHLRTHHTPSECSPNTERRYSISIRVACSPRGFKRRVNYFLCIKRLGRFPFQSFFIKSNAGF